MTASVTTLVNVREWIVVGVGDRSILGRFRKTGTGTALDDFLDRGVLALEPAFDLLTLQAADAAGRIQRKAAVAPIDFAAHGVPLYVRPTTAYFCADMHQDDQKTYEGLVRSGLDALARARAARSGIALP